MPRRTIARKAKQPPRAAPALRSAALRPMDAPEVADPGPQPSHDNQGLVARFLDARDVAASTRAAYRTDLLLFAAALGPQSLRDVQAEDVRRWLREHTRDPAVPGGRGAWTPRTAARKLAVLKAFYAWARNTPRDPAYGDPVPADYDAGEPLPLVTFNPVAQLRAPAFARPDPVRLAREALRRLFDWWEERIAALDTLGTDAARRERALHVLDVALFRLCYHLGLRVGSAQALQLRALDLADPDRWIATAYVKGNKPRRKVIAGVVKADVERWLAIRLTLTPRAHLRRRKPDATSPLSRPTGDPDAYLFLHPWTGRVLSRRRAWERLLLAGEAAGLSPAVVRQLSPHKLRHAVAYHALADGHSLTDVQGLLDHEDVRTTTVYVEANEAQRFRTMEQLSSGGALRR
ncbi:tyrosine recombinase XerD [Gemmatimonadetes bacterium T265]|nr:tyrosine recombinase XerD [Gemmatimonadetes bacterium T265]